MRLGWAGSPLASMAAANKLRPDGAASAQAASDESPSRPTYGPTTSLTSAKRCAIMGGCPDTVTDGLSSDAFG